MILSDPLHWSHAAGYELSQRLYWLQRAQAAEMAAFTTRSGTATLVLLTLAMARLASRDQWLNWCWALAVRSN